MSTATQSGFSALWQRCWQQPRYWLAGVIVVGIGLFGRASTPATLLYPAGYSNPLWTADRSLAVGQLEQRFPELLNSAAGDYWRFLVTARADTIESDRSGLPGATSEMLSVWLRSSSAAEQLVGTFEVPVSKDYSVYEFAIKTTANYRDLVVRREDAESRALVMLNVPQVTRLNVTTDAQLSALRPTLIGSTRVAVASTEVDPDNELGLAQINEENGRVGQIFKAESAILSGLGFKLQRSGNGGLGTYMLGLYKVERSDGRYDISAEPMVCLKFSADGAFRYYAEQPGGYEIHFPILANLEVGSYYYAALSAVDIRSGALNGLALAGDTSTAANNDWPALKVSGSTNTIIGQAYLKTYTVELNNHGGVSLPSGVRVLDLGNGDGLYSYQKGNSLIGVFNISNHAALLNQIAVDNFASPTNVPLDQELIYELDTVYPFKSLNLRISPLSVDPQAVTVGLYYSFDKTNWNLFEADEASLAEGVLDQAIAGDGTNHRVYIKAVGTSTRTDQSGLWFGLGEIRATAGLQIN
jgi:hypothetical protein